MAQIEKRPITNELKESYLDYAMSVIVSRALPDARDGLKPVHRRILWAMWESGLTHSTKFRKSANVVGETLGKYHPHGDAAVYDALVRMAQEFSMRYPIIEGQGNFGSVDGDSAAAMRYTEVRLAKIAEELLRDIEKDTVDWRPNYDGTRKEPVVLPAKLPHLLLNGTLGIAVGMATNIPPHNLAELVDAILYLADHPKATHQELMRIIQGPDFPTGGLIFNREEIVRAYAEGRGTITMRARVEMEERKKKSGSSSWAIVVTELPYQVNKAELIARIAALVQEKKIEGIRDLRDESDKEGLRVVIELKGEVAPQKVLNYLYRHTDLQRDFHMNLVALTDGLQPQLLSIKEALQIYLDHRKEVVRRRTQFDLNRAKERAHILEGLAKALHAIDRVIATIKKAKDKEDARSKLVRQFSLTEAQATAILEMRLQTLAALERKKIEDELKEKKKLIKELTLILKSPARMLAVIKGELRELKEQYGDPRRTKVVARPVATLTEEDYVQEEEVVITLSAGGYIKRIAPGAFRSQRRGGKGLIGSDVGDEDFISHFLCAHTHDRILFFTDRGKVFQARGYEIPQGSRTAKGKAVHHFLEIAPSDRISAIVNVGKEDEAKYLVMATESGMIKKTSLNQFRNIRRTGIMAIDLKKGDALRWVGTSRGNDEILLITRKGQAIRFRESQVRATGRNSAGVRAIRLKQGDKVIGFDIIREKDSAKVLTVMENGFAKQTPLAQYKLQQRGGLGIKTANITEKTGEIVAGRIVTQEEEILALSAKGQIIKTALASVRTTSRAAQGVRIMHLKKGDSIAGIVVR